ncbi:AlpA family transcriptional regulator [Acidocella sp.]|uniref:helix-turn-helix transcriptional regulator n=1 Tax=Acidocella sp. TaxID=50710 RepID=UPI002626F88A|nr:helix-turn-helix domain-containing protein [Acidocella sp.]
MDDDNARAANAKKGSPFLNTDQAAFFVGLSRRTLEKMRTAGGGPHYRKHGRYVRYHIADLEEWSNSSGKSSTSDAGAAARGTGKPGRKDA